MKKPKKPIRLWYNIIFVLVLIALFPKFVISLTIIFFSITIYCHKKNQKWFGKDYRWKYYDKNKWQYDYKKQ